MLGTLTSYRTSTLSAGLLALSTVAALAATSEPERHVHSVAIIDRAQGEARVERDGKVSDLKLGQKIGRRDVVSTGTGSRISIKFNDGSHLALGENARLFVADYLEEEGRRSGAMILELLRGAFRLVTSQPVAAPHKRVEVRTSAARLMSTGADLWSGPVDGKQGVIVMRGKVNVRNEAGLAVLEGKRRATMVPDRTRAPEKPVVWSSDRARKSLLTVAFQ